MLEGLRDVFAEDVEVDHVELIEELFLLVRSQGICNA